MSALKQGTPNAAAAERLEDATGLTDEFLRSPRLASIHAIYTPELVNALEVVRRAAVQARRYLQESEGRP